MKRGCWAKSARSNAGSFEKSGGFGKTPWLNAKASTGTASGATVAAYSVGQQIAIGATTFACGFAAFWCLLEAFNVGGSVRNVLLVLGVNAVAALVPFTPGGAGVQQALLVKVFGTGATVAAYSVGQQIAIAGLTFCIGLASVVWIFRFRSFKEVIAAGRASRAEAA